MQNVRESIKENMREKIVGKQQLQEVQIISFSDNKDNISWEDNSKEFVLNGEMYDLVKMVNENGKTLLYCLHDVKEKQVIEKYNSITKHNTSGNKKEGSNSDNTTNIFLESKTSLDNIVYLLIENIHPIFDCHLQAISLTKYSPPPEA